MAFQTNKAPILGGKKSILTKRDPDFDYDEWAPSGNNLKIPPKVMNYGKEKGLEFRWLSSETLTKNMGYHPSGWKVFKVPDNMDVGLADFHIGKQPDGSLRRNTQVLGYKPKPAAEDHRRILRDRAARWHGKENSYQEMAAEKLRSISGDVKVLEGYEENDPDKKG